MKQTRPHLTGKPHAPFPLNNKRSPSNEVVMSVIIFLLSLIQQGLGLLMTLQGMFDPPVGLT